MDEVYTHKDTCIVAFPRVTVVGRWLTSRPTCLPFLLSASVNYHPRQLVKQFFTFGQMSVVHLSRSRGLRAPLILNSVGLFESWQCWQDSCYSLISPVDRTHLFYLVPWIPLKGNFWSFKNSLDLSFCFCLIIKPADSISPFLRGEGMGGLWHFRRLKTESITCNIFLYLLQAEVEKAIPSWGGLSPGLIFFVLAFLCLKPGRKMCWWT